MISFAIESIILPPKNRLPKDIAIPAIIAASKVEFISSATSGATAFAELLAPADKAKMQADKIKKFLEFYQIFSFLYCDQIVLINILQFYNTQTFQLKN